MKIIINVVMLAMLLAGCRYESSPPPLKFTAYEGNPILSPGVQGSWDELFLWSPQVIKDKGNFYLFYLGGKLSGRMAIGLAISHDGYQFNKYSGNPILSPDNEGFDAVTVGPGIVLRKDSTWLMYYNAQELATFAPGPSAGRATSASLTGPWRRSETPVITSGDKGEWDADFIIPSSVLVLEDGSFMMFYTGGQDLSRFEGFSVGMALSPDGINWKKYNDPRTRQHPFEESDPVMIPGKTGEWDGAFVWMANVTSYDGGYRMYYSGAKLTMREEIKAIGYATSEDGIHWKKYSKNPVYRSDEDSFIKRYGGKGFMENPSIIYVENTCFLYYECGPFGLDSCYIAVATAAVE